MAGLYSFFLGLPIAPYMHVLNWKALGRPDEAAKSAKWAWAMLTFDIVFVAIVVTAKSGDSNLSSFAFGRFLLLVVWAAMNGRRQQKFVKALPPGSVTERSQWTPWGMGLAYAALIFGFVLVTTVLRTAGPGIWKGDDSILPAIQNRSGRAEAVTKQMIEKTLKSPRSAQYSNFRILDSNGLLYQTIITVDSQNSYGALVRGEFLCAFRFEDDSLEKYTFNRWTSLFDLSEMRGTREYNIREKGLLQKLALKWPGVEDPNSKNDSKSPEPPADSESKNGEPPKKTQEEVARELEAKQEEEERKRTEAQQAAKLKQKAQLEAEQKEAERKKAVSMKRAEQLTKAKTDLAAIEDAIVGDQEAFNLANAEINKLTNFRKTPVQQGSQAYYRCVAASDTIKAVEANTPKLKAEKARLEELIKGLEKEDK